MLILGYFISIIIGVSLGLIGSGGSIFTVPILVYLFKVDIVAATAYSLFIVGTTSLVGATSYFKKGLVNIKTAILFGIPSIISVFITRSYILPSIPNIPFNRFGITIQKDTFLLVLFAILMLASSLSMIRKSKEYRTSKNEAQKFNILFFIFEGIVVGILTGLVGAGGGFLIIPTLIILSKLPIKEAIGTSLVIITTNSLIGFLGDGNKEILDWNLLLSVTLFAIVGIFIGIALSKKIDGARLKPILGWFILVMGIYILIKELFL
jgi:uncharacterized membrane protein YfcA